MAFIDPSPLRGKYAEELAVIKPATTHWIDKMKSDQNDESYWPYMNGNFVFKNAIIGLSK